ncbi:MAG: formate acetyltransferase [bacterium]|nr:formate acetyltransferase [bacterium]
MSKNTNLNRLTGLLLRLMALTFSLRPSLKKYLNSADGWINFSIVFKTLTGTVSQAIVFENGSVRVPKTIPSQPDSTLEFVDDEALKEMMRITPNEVLNLVLKNRIIMNGNLSYIQAFNFYVSLLIGKKHQRMLKKQHKKDLKSRKKEYGSPSKKETPVALNTSIDTGSPKKNPPREKGVKHLTNPSLREYSLSDFPRLDRFLNIHFSVTPEICVERPAMLTRWFRKNGFDNDPPLNQAKAFNYYMENKKPIIREQDLLAGTTTAKEIGVLIYPDAQGTMAWGELRSIPSRVLNPYDISKQDADILHHEVFPFWAKRNFREWIRAEKNAPLCQKIDERFVAYFVWKSVGISHTIPNFPVLLKKGLKGIIADIKKKSLEKKLSPEQGHSLRAMELCLEGTILYAKNLSAEAARLAELEKDPVRKNELLRLSEICARVPAEPPQSLDEALNSLWITWIGLHMENTNTGLSLGRLDQWLQPFFEKDIKKLTASGAKTGEITAYIKHAIELVGCFFMRCTDHLPLSPDIGNYLFSGSSSDQAITLGGTTPAGKDGVCDMTYIFLKVTEMLSIRDPNINARFMPGINSDAYLKRLCEVNLVTAATPSMHNDSAVFKSLSRHGYPLPHIRDWSATGCVEPTLSGKHMGHTGSILMNIVAALEMALNNGTHPLMNWKIGPETGDPEKDREDFKNFDDFFKAFAAQFRFLVENSVELNNTLAETHAKYRPSPLLSALMEGSIKKGLDVTRGGARYNSSGSSNIGLADVTDSLLVIKKLVFNEQEKRVGFDTLKQAIDSNFKNDPALRALVSSRVPLFGSGDAEALDMACRVADCIHATWTGFSNFRGGPYTTGFWSMSQHVAYGSLSGALPSGRAAWKAFTPGLTPHPSASKNFLDNIRDVARLNPHSMDNNIAFNVKLVPGSGDSREKTVDAMFSYVKSYFDLGGMQIQFNVVTPETLRDAMANPDQYKNLLVRISGYNAYFVTLNKDMQIELIERAEYGV